MLDINNLMGKAREMQEKVKEAQENLFNIRASAESGAGMVKATVNGKKQVISIEVDNDLIKPEDKEMMEDLIAAAVNKALEEAERIAREEIAKVSQGMMPNIPGMDLSKFGM